MNDKYTQGERGKRALGYNFEEQQHLRGRKQKEHTEDSWRDGGRPRESSNAEAKGTPSRGVVSSPVPQREHVR